MSDDGEDYGFEYSDDDQEEEDVNIENQSRAVSYGLGACSSRGHLLLPSSSLAPSPPSASPSAGITTQRGSSATATPRRLSTGSRRS